MLIAPTRVSPEQHSRTQRIRLVVRLRDNEAHVVNGLGILAIESLCTGEAEKRAGHSATPTPGRDGL